ncbi:MAG TPA: VOC family protein [candidate division Zixibacteria bacterium]|nr:VOC family protein [candidate division Zixibacteria bacterium]
MLTGIDHLVIVVRDLDLASRDYRQLGFTVIPGGRHPVGSHNALITFADGSYLELIAFYRDAPDHRWWEPLQRGERLVDYCCRTDDLQSDTGKLREAGVAINDPVPWSRIRPDGYELRWLLALATGSHRGVAPFLIQDVTPREERVPPDSGHPNRAAGIDTVTIAVSELSEPARWYRSVLSQSGEPVENRALGARGLRFLIGPHAVELITPRQPQSPLADWLRLYGPSPYAARLRSDGGPRMELDPRLTHGANLSIGS